MDNLKRILKNLFDRQPQSSTADTLVSPAEPPADRQIQSLIDCLATTQEVEDDCAEFDKKMDCLAELLAQGKSPSEVITPEVETHLLHSNDCREEFEALIAILKAEEAGELENLS